MNTDFTDYTDVFIGGGCPKTQYQMSEILQSVSLLDDSGLANGCNSRLSGQNTSKSSRGAFNLKVESSRNGVLGQAGGASRLEALVPL